MMINNEKATSKNIISGISWTLAERIVAQVASFIVSIILARLLDPSAYGLLALANIFIAIMNAISLTGFGKSLIQKKNATIVDFSSTLYLSLFSGFIAYSVLFFIAPYISAFFNVQHLSSVIRVAGLVLISASINIIQRAYITRNFQFKRLFISSLLNSIVSAVIGVLFAYRGYGVWALVAQLLSKSIADVFLLAILSEFKPILSFSFSSVKQIYSFGWKIIVASLIDSLYEQSRSIVIGKQFNESDLAFYHKGMQFPSLLINNLDITIANVMFTAISREQDNILRVKEMVRKAVRFSSFIIFPLLICLMVCSHNVILLLLTEKWLPSVAFMQILCVALMFKPIQTASLQGILAIGRSDLYLKVRFVQKVIGITILLITALLWNSTLAIAMGEVISYIVFMFVVMIPNNVLLSYKYFEQLKDLLPQFLIAILMGILVNPISKIDLPILLILLFQVIVGLFFYFLLSYLLKTIAFKDAKDIFYVFIKRKREVHS